MSAAVFQRGPCRRVIGRVQRAGFGLWELLECGHWGRRGRQARERRDARRCRECATRPDKWERRIG